jgi:hypothetical protein
VAKAIDSNVAIAVSCFAAPAGDTRVGLR